MAALWQRNPATFGLSHQEHWKCVQCRHVMCDLARIRSARCCHCARRRSFPLHYEPQGLEFCIFKDPPSHSQVLFRAAAPHVMPVVHAPDHRSPGFVEFVRRLNACKDRAEEQRLTLRQALATQDLLGHPDTDWPCMRECVVQALLCEMAGQRVEAAHTCSLKLVAAASLVEKRTGYLGMVQMVAPGHSTMLLAVATVQRDLHSGNFIEVTPCGRGRWREAVREGEGGGGRSSPLKERGGGGCERGSRDRPVQRGWSETSDDESPPAPQAMNFFSKKNSPTIRTSE